MIEYSVIVPTYNRAALLEKNLEALACQSIPAKRYEIILVNDGSHDHTNEIVSAFRAKYPEINIVYIRQENRGVAHARNVGIRQARGETLFFTDDDCVVPNRWLETLGDAYNRHPEIAGVGGWYEYDVKKNNNRAIVNYYTASILKRYGDKTMSMEICSCDFIRNPAGNTSNMSYRKNVLQRIGGFDTKMRAPGFDDTELKKRIMDLGYPLLYVPYPVLHLRPLKVLDVIKRAFIFGRGRYYFAKKNRELRRFYFPSLRGGISWRFEVVFGAGPRFMATLDLLCTRAGWEYQRYLERSFSN